MTLNELRKWAADDFLAATHQSMGQYRTALLNVIDEVAGSAQQDEREAGNSTLCTPFVNIMRECGVNPFSKAWENSWRVFRATQQVQADAGAVYWEYRTWHGENTVTPGWDEWKRVEGRDALYTAEAHLADLRAYIERGYRYELRALYTRPAGESDKRDAALEEAARIVEDFNADRGVVQFSEIACAIRAAMSREQPQGGERG